MIKKEATSLPLLETETMTDEKTLPARINLGGTYVAKESNPSAGKIDQEELTLVATGFFVAFVAVLLIFLPIRDMERQTTFAAGLSMLGGASTLITRTLSKSK